MNRCLQCGTAMIVHIENYKDSLLGVPALLLGIEIYRCPNCGEYEIVIPCHSGLLRFIAHKLLEKPSRFAGNEIAYLRKYLDMTADELAKQIGVKRGTISRWERNSERIGIVADRLLRMLVYCAKPNAGFPAEKFSRISSRVGNPLKFVLRFNGTEWETVEQVNGKNTKRYFNPSHALAS